MSDDSSQPANTMVERSSNPKWKLWLLLNGNRWLVTALLAAFAFVGLLVISQVSPVSLRALMGEKEPVHFLFQALVTSLITGVTLVLTINQLVLSQELGAVDDQRGRLEGSLKFHEDVEDVIDAPISPPDPASFLQAIIDASLDRAVEFREAVDDSRDEEFEDRVNDFVDNINSHAETVHDELDDAQFGTYEVIKSALDYNYSWKIFRARRLRNVHADSFTDEARDAHDQLLESLKLFGLAREHFKTLYFQWELINLSRGIMYVSVPSLIVAMSMIAFFDADAVSGTALGIDTVVWVVVAAATVSIVPFLLLVSFVLRLGTMAKRTLAIGPFILRESNRNEEIDWD
ncbi:hypothetical protein C491_04901 [Natronococcus amylolyticus DSM 10524]|uniref:Uncharacterized protein n=1 Tax=Natronococcus amylolyticus DSM 10524 TaxID=1227497 RepID=L9XG71_9EURY|nr:hypothetical protein [Natronococcus amylolyticus]ELY59678.1 hypothetical protein C491_04901 [Natronococcus amylolyticus DSM 10524]